MEWPLLAPSRRWGQFRSASWGVKRTSRLGAQVVSLIDPGTLPAPDYSGLEVADGFNSGRVLKAFEAAKTLRSSGVVTNDPAFVAGHPLQAGFLTSAAGKGASIFKMMDVSRHKSVDTLRGHVRDAELFKDHAGAGLL